jgi:hypothetical protein
MPGQLAGICVGVAVALAVASTPVRRGKQAGINPEGAAHRDVRRFWSSRRLLPKIPGLLADPAALSPGATIGRLSFGYFSLPFKEK